MNSQPRTYQRHLNGKILRVLIAIGIACAIGSIARAQEAEPEIPIVREIVVRQMGGTSVPEARILANMATRVGDPLDDSGSADIRSLYASGLVDDVQTEYEQIAGGVRLIIKVKALGTLGKIEFLGNSQIDNERLQRAVSLAVGDPVEDLRFQEGRASILEMYRRRGYPDVGASYRTEQMQDGFTAVTFSINEGQQSYLRNVIFEGNTVFDQRELRKVMETRKRGPLSFLTKSGKIDNDVLEQDIENVAAHYRNAGYLNADVTNVERTRVDDDTVDLILQITEGEKYSVATVGISGMTVFADADVLPQLELIPGEAYSAGKISEDTQMLRDFYGSRGYADIRVNPRIDPGEGRSLRVTYQITEGRKSYVNKINIGGNVKTTDKVIRRELAVSPGDEFNTVLLEASRKRLEGLLYFSEVSVLPTDADRTGYKDINIQVAETSTGSVNFGAGFSSIDNLVAFLDVEQTNFNVKNPPNFTGAGQKFRMGIKYGTRRRDFQLSLVEPWFMDQRLSLGGDLFYQDRFYLSDEYDQRNVGGAVHLRKPIGEHAYIRGEYRLQSIKINNIDDDASEAIRAEEGTFLQSQLGFTFVHDTRDSFTLPREGHKIEVGTEFSGSFLGGDVDVVGVNLGASQHFNLPGDSILTLEGRLNVADAWGDADRVPIFERNFLGGANNLRGFDYRDVGPKDETGEPLGGGTAAYFTAEYSVPIIERIRGAVFYDAGFVNDDSFDYSTSNYNSNYGLGLRLFIPRVGMIRLDYGIPLEADEFNDNSGRFNFNLGYRF